MNSPCVPYFEDCIVLSLQQNPTHLKLPAYGSWKSDWSNEGMKKGQTHRQKSWHQVGGVCFDEGTCYSPQPEMSACSLHTAQGEGLARHFLPVLYIMCLKVSRLRLQTSRRRKLQFLCSVICKHTCKHCQCHSGQRKALPIPNLSSMEKALPF